MWLHFQNPQQIITTKNLNKVREALQNVEALVNDKKWHAAGFVSYEAAQAFDPALQTFESHDFPLIWFGLYENPTNLTSLVGQVNQISQAWQPNIDKERYNTAIQKIKDYIANGKTYQVNYTMRLISDLSPDAWNLFMHLAQAQNKYAAFLEMDDWAICCASPELFFDLDGDVITSKPMKGTVKRGRTSEEDNIQTNWLRASEKNQAENVMIVDMIRNDLGKIALQGSVYVPELFGIEKYSTLFQMTSTVQAKTKASVTQIFSALFPCASITGAPKISTMKIINELETSPRKIYTGSIGYISPNRKARFNVAIRTVLIDKKNKKAEYGVGGGIVWDSEDKDEYEEALLKAQVLTNPSQPDFSLFETLLWTKNDGFFLFDKHVTRLADSAQYFDFPFSQETVEVYLKEIIKDKKTTQRVKVLLDKSGNLTSEVKGLSPENKVFTATLARGPVNSNNVFLFHKTTYRDVYEKAIPSDVDEVLLFNEKDELTEFTIGNLVVEENGKFFTPPIECGLLTGTFREYLLETGKIKERVLYKAEFYNFSKIFLINSVRKWVEVKIKK